MNREDVIRRLKEEQSPGYPGLQALLDEKWYASLSEDDKSTVTEVLRELLRQREELGPVLWFLSWAVPLPSLAPELAALAPYIDELVETNPRMLAGNSYLAMYVSLVATIGLREVLPFLHKWASLGSGPTDVHTHLAERAAIAILRFSKEEGVRYAPVILKGDVKFDTAVTYSSTRHFISYYLYLYPHDVAPLAQAYSGLDAVHSEYVYRAVQMAAQSEVEIGAQDSQWRESVLYAFRCVLFH